MSALIAQYTRAWILPGCWSARARSLRPVPTGTRGVGENVHWEHKCRRGHPGAGRLVLCARYWSTDDDRGPSGRGRWVRLAASRGQGVQSMSLSWLFCGSDRSCDPIHCLKNRTRDTHPGSLGWVSDPSAGYPTDIHLHGLLAARDTQAARAQLSSKECGAVVCRLQRLEEAGGRRGTRWRSCGQPKTSKADARRDASQVERARGRSEDERERESAKLGGYEATLVR